MIVLDTHVLVCWVVTADDTVEGHGHPNELVTSMNNKSRQYATRRRVLVTGSAGFLGSKVR